MIAVLLTLHLASAQAPSPAAEPLTIGSASPKLAPVAFVRGEAVKELAKGTVYVVEFSGTQCAPCVKCIPHLNELQKKYPAVVFLSIYSEEEKVVNEFLKGLGKDIAIRVAVDPKRAMGLAWSDAACQEGIPHAFIVGADKRIAWIGNAAEIADPLAAIVAGKFDPQEDVLRLKVEQAAVLRLRKAEEREEKGIGEYNRINELIIAGKLETALADTEKALAAFGDCPRTSSMLRMAHVFVLANSPGRRDDAFKLAIEMSVDAKASGQSLTMTSTAVALLNAAERAAPKARDKRLIDLAMPLLRDPLPEDLRGKPERELQEHLIGAQRLVGYAYHLRGDPTRAATAIRDAMEMVRKLKLPAGANADQFAESTKQRLKDLETILKEYAGEKTAGERR